MATREKQRKLLEVLRALERDGARLSVDDFVEHVERATGYKDAHYYLTGRLSGALVHRRDSDDTVTVEGAVAVNEDDFANPEWELPTSVWRRQVESVVPALDSNERARIARQLAEDAARCEAAGVHFNPPFLPPALRSPSQQIGWRHPFIGTTTLETWDAPSPEPRVDKLPSASTWEDRIKAVGDRVTHALRNAERAKWIDAWPSGISYDVCRAAGDSWSRIKILGTFATLEEALACAAAVRAGAD